MKIDIFESLVQFVEIQRWKYNFPLKKTTQIERELRITGDDAIEFLIEYGKYFNVDVTKFMAADYFDGEGMNWLLPNSNSNKKILTLGDLVKGIIAGQLNEQVINS